MSNRESHSLEKERWVVPLKQAVRPQEKRTRKTGLPLLKE